MAHAQTNRVKTSSSKRGELIVPESFGRGKRYSAIVKLLRAGWQPREIAERFAPDNPKKARHLIREAQRIAGLDPQVRAYYTQAAAGILVSSIPEAAEGLADRAAGGRPDAAKLLFEATGFHNSRVDHNHTGEVKLTLDMPRPPAVDADVEDADVVD